MAYRFLANPADTGDIVDPIATNHRDAGLTMIRRINRWLIAGAIGLSGAVSVATARSFHDRNTTNGAATATTPERSQTSAAPTPSSDDGSSDLRPPTQVPTPASAGPAVSSGGS